MSENGTANTSETAAVCPTCEAALPAEARFCPGCGLAQAAEAPVIELVASTLAVTTELPVAQPEDVPAATRTRFWTLRRGLIAGSVAVAMVAAALALILTRSPSTARLTTALTASNRATSEVATEFGRADSLREVNEAATRAGEAHVATRKRAASLRGVGTRDLRDATAAALLAEADFLQKLSTLSGMNEASLRDWPTTRGELEERVRLLDHARTRLALLKSDASLPVADADGAVKALDRLLTESRRKLDEWAAQRDKAEADKRAQHEALTAYENAFRPLVKQYTGLRQDMKDFIDRVDSSGSSFTEAFAFLSTASSERSRVKNSMTALVPPAPLAAAQTAVVHVIDRAIEAVNSASSGVKEYQLSGYYGYSYYKQTPGWQAFERSSDRISKEYDEALRAWEASFTAERNRLNSLPTPAKPEL